MSVVSVQVRKSLSLLWVHVEVTRKVCIILIEKTDRRQSQSELPILSDQTGVTFVSSQTYICVYGL